MTKAKSYKAPFTAWFQKLPNNFKGVIFFMVGALGFSLMVAAIKWLGQHIHITQILFIRQIVMVLFVVHRFSDNPIAALKTDHIGLQFVRVSAALIAMICGFSAIIHMDLATATAIGFSKGFFITIFAIFILGEVAGIRRWSAIAIGFIGVFIMLRPTVDGITFYEILAIIGAAGAGLAMVTIRKLTRTEKPITILAYQAFFVGVAVSIPALYFWQWPSPLEWIVMLSIGVGAFFSQHLNINAHKYAEASLLAVLDYIRIIYATILGILIFNQYPNIYTFVGAIIVIVAAAYTLYRERKKKKEIDKNPVRTGV